MKSPSQQDVIAFLTTPAAHGGVPVERIDTHSAMVLLAGTRAMKLKRAVRFDYLDFSTLELRRKACEAELRINRRTAPAIYRGVGCVTLEADGRLAIDGDGVAVEWFVDMVRFDQEALLDRHAARGALDLALMRPLGSAIARFHLAAEARSDHGGEAGMRWVVDGNAEGLAEQGRGMLDPAIAADVTAGCRRELDRHGRLLDARRANGLVRQCHGDLHLRNIVLLDGQPTLFDAIEFNDEIACVDVLYDLAFLLMDLWRRGLPRHANHVFNGYLAETGDLAGLPLLPFFLACRAAVRAKTSATAARVERDAARRGELETLARTYLAMARDLLQPPAPRLVAIGGFSGSGKSTLALSLAPSTGPAPGALVIRSDEVRKALCGVAPLDRLDAGGYSEEMTARVYRTMAERARTALRAKHAVIVDAVFARPADRQAIEAVAASADVPFIGLWLDAPEPVLAARTTARRADASDADARIVHRQLAVGPGALDWRRLDASRGAGAVLADAIDSGVPAVNTPRR
jgi:aminoglycoside phosphotransferase family enzyme/predicted kinase